MAKIESKFDIEDRFNEHVHNGSDSKKINFSNIDVTPGSAITAPSGGMTIDSQSRTAINAIITVLETRGFIEEN